MVQNSHSQHSPRPRKKRKRRRRVRWGRVAVALAIMLGCVLLISRSCSRHGSEPEPAQPQEQPQALEQPAAPDPQAADEGALDDLGDNDDADEASAVADASEGNPYDRHLPEMPDDGCVKLAINPIGGTLGKVFCDSNYLHLQAARSLGIDPIVDDASAWRLKRPLVEARSCREYFVADLSHSYPYLVPEAEQLLREIGGAFNDSLQARGGGSYRIKVTSLLRTPLTVRSLRRVNRNATGESAHQYATTFDISYGKFICDSADMPRTQEDLKNLLAEVLNDFRNRGRCYIKHERKQACFHITVRPGS